jgi:hypothetical protein
MSMACHAGKQCPAYLNYGRPQKDDKERRENKENQGEQQLDRELCGHFLGPLISPDPHGVRVDPQGLSHAGAELVRLD